jgi:hypothetical protein
MPRRAPRRVPVDPQIVIRSASGQRWVAQLPPDLLARLRLHASADTSKNPAAALVTLLSAALTSAADEPRE